MNDEIRPNYYKVGNYEVFDLIQATGGEDYFNFGNILKYLFRFQYKNGIEDLKKAETYIKKMIGSNFKIQNEDEFNTILFEMLRTVKISLKNKILEIILALKKYNFVEAKMKIAELIGWLENYEQI